MGGIVARLGLRVVPAMLLAVGVVLTGGAGRLASAQGITIECAPTNAVASLAPASGGAPVAATPVADEVTFPEGGGELTVFAAASLTDAFEQVAADLEGANDGLEITYNFAGSQVLVTQLAEGAVADVFASANTAQMTAAEENGSIAGDPVTFARNRLAIAVPAENPGGLDAAADLGNNGLRLALAQAEVPVGRYAREAICAMGDDAATYGEGFVERIAANVVTEDEDVRDVLVRVELGEVDAGIVYVSDAAATGDAVELIEIPDAVNVVATYPIAAVEGGDAALAEAFIAYVLGPDGQATLGQFGFEPIGS